MIKVEEMIDFYLKEYSLDYGCLKTGPYIVE